MKAELRKQWIVQEIPIDGQQEFQKSKNQKDVILKDKKWQEMFQN